jgi:hypothetical protein
MKEHDSQRADGQIKRMQMAKRRRRTGNETYHASFATLRRLPSLASSLSSPSIAFWLARLEDELLSSRSALSATAFLECTQREIRDGDDKT